MRHLSLNIELETPISYHDGIIQAGQEISKKVGDKFNSYIYVNAMLYSTVETSAFALSKIMLELANAYAYSDYQIIKIKCNVKRSKTDILCIDIFEMELADAYDSRD